MKMRYNILLVVMVAFAIVACTNDSVVDFGTDCDKIEVDAVGGIKKVRVSSADEWVASVELDAPWIAVSQRLLFAILRPIQSVRLQLPKRALTMP